MSDRLRVYDSIWFDSVCFFFLTFFFRQYFRGDRIAPLYTFYAIRVENTQIAVSIHKLNVRIKCDMCAVRVIATVHPKYFCLENDGASMVFILFVILERYVRFFYSVCCCCCFFSSFKKYETFFSSFFFSSDHCLFYDYFTHTLFLFLFFLCAESFSLADCINVW